VRHAIAQAFDFEWANRVLFYGAYKRADSYFENSDLAAEGVPGAEELKLLEPLRDEQPAIGRQPRSGAGKSSEGQGPAG
jgi:microcin C transport system substrate-binding protein